MSALYLFAAHLAVFTLGLYASSHFVFDEPIEPYRWIIAISLFCLFGILSATIDD